MKNAKVTGMLMGFVLVTGATFNLAKYAVQYFSAASAAGWRFGIAAVVMFALLIIQKKVKWETILRHGITYTILGIVGIFGFNAFFFFGMNHTSPLNGALIMGTNPLVTLIMAFFILRTPITKQQTMGIFFALLGVTLVLTRGSWEVIQTLSFSKGDILILAGNVCWALYGVLGRKYLKTSSSLETTTYTMITGALFLVILAIFSPSTNVEIKTPIIAWGAILFMAIFTSVLGYLWWNKAMERIGPANTAVFFNLVPVVTMLISVVTGTPVTNVQVIGTVMVISGVLISSGFLNIGKVYKVITRSLS
ncbi:drug/metabolite transporter (DMT)-like permease [Bacillus sp. SORGH_AS 510]|uniref:DMT family transporter n=1 Tax=Bacillus sp. SORGH_AS_0510 TaxID=3041771 RepID=UPI0027843A59|nr:DMT family transporter [Bacillus sp. SORGH_AS_0510]MDQ1147528.1 drug/metabolite transporter (DMT)-like permease [Bacillus sp. SORGH_AS_0510]